VRGAFGVEQLEHAVAQVTGALVVGGLLEERVDVDLVEVRAAGQLHLGAQRGSEVLDGEQAGAVAGQFRLALPLAAVRDSFNAVFVEGGAAGDLMFYGRGAGGAPSASAVLGDVIDAANNLRRGVHASMGVLMRPRLRPIDDLQSAYYLSLDVVDQPGVLASVATLFGKYEVSIRSMEQIGLADEARLIFITHAANERDFQATLHDLRGLDSVRHVGSVMRVIGE